MGFSLFEIGNHSGRPVFLYEFTWGSTVWRYTSADRDIEYELAEDGVTPLVWTAISISDEGFVQGGGTAEFVIKAPISIPLVGLFRSTPPALPIQIVVRRYHRDDPDKEATVYWQGTVGNVKRSGPISARIYGLPISATFRRIGLRLCWEANCPHMLYDGECKVNRDLFKTAATITAMTGTTITVSTLGAFAGPQYAGGFFEWTATPEGTKDRRGIERHIAGNQFAVFGSTDRLVVGQAITLYLGCDLTAETCEMTFNNLANHGGFGFMPKKSPFDGDPVF